MSQVIFGQEFTGGRVEIPPSKSAAHRLVLGAALSRGQCVLSHVDMSEDIAATVGAVEALGVRTSYDPETSALSVDARGLCGKEAVIDCGESGSTLRFLIPVAAALGARAHFVGRGRLPSRPLGVYEELLPEKGVALDTQGGLPLELSGKLQSGVYRLPGNVSSQFVTGLLMALPLLEGDSEIVLTSPLESQGYVELTLSVLRDFGVSAQATGRGWKVPGGQCYRARSCQVEGDWSQAAFFLCMAAVSGRPVEIAGLREDSLQGDKACVELFGRFGLETRWEGGILQARNPRWEEPYRGLKGFVIDAAQIPDMVPSLAVCAALSQGETRIVHAQRLRLKESDRLAAMEEALQSLGGRVVPTEDGLAIQGVPQLSGGSAQGKNDHRVVMALAAAALGSAGDVTVTDAQSIRKSYPRFFEDFRKLGGSAHVLDLG